MYRQARSAVVTLLRREERLCIFPQNVIEFWSVATRPAQSNGLGLGLPQAEWYVSRLESILTFMTPHQVTFSPSGRSTLVPGGATE